MSPSNSVHTARQPRDTGFPEPFSSRTTTLPHPEADLSPNACIGQDDIHVDFARKHGGLSFLHRSKKPKKTTTLGHGALVPSASTNRSAVSLLAGQSAVSLASAANNSSSRTRDRSTSSGSRRDQSRERSSSGSNHRQPLPCPHSNSQPSIIETLPSPTGSKYVRDSFATTRRDDEETPPTSPDDASVKSSRRLFNKFRRH